MRISIIVVPIVGVLLFASSVFAQTTNAAASNTCPNLYRTLSRGSRGSDVTSLQRFFIAQGLLNSNSATGYFGPATEAAVQKWQARNAIVSSGTPATTGYGAIGPRTRARLASLCSGGSAAVTSPADWRNFKLLSPNGGETYASGQPIKISWTIGQGTHSQPFEIMLMNDGTFLNWVNKKTYATKTLSGVYEYIWTPSSIELAALHSNTFTISITSAFPDGNRVADYSDAPFSFIVSDEIAWLRNARTLLGSIVTRMREHATQLRSYSEQYGRYVCPAGQQSKQADVRAAVESELADVQTALAAFETLASQITGDTPQSVAAIRQFSGFYMFKDEAVYENNLYLPELQKVDMELKQICSTAGTVQTNTPTSSVDNSPIIQSFTGPSTLTVNQQGTWTVVASDTDNQLLSYEMYWGDELQSHTPSRNQAATPSYPNTTYAHSYAYPKAGVYTITVYVYDSAGNRTQTTSTVNVSEPVTVPTPSISFQASQGVIKSGVPNSTLSWSASNANRCVMQYDITRTEESVNISGSKVVSPAQTTAYTLLCTNDPGNGQAGPSSQKTILVSVSCNETVGPVCGMKSQISSQCLQWKTCALLNGQNSPSCGTNVCASDPKTYQTFTNSCRAQEAGFEVAYAGSCH